MSNQHRIGKAASLLGGIILLAGCATDPAPVEDRTLESRRPAQIEHRAEPANRELPGSTYRVAHGDTLYSIAFKRGLDFRDVAAWNGIGPPYKILVDQNLRLTPPGGTVRNNDAVTAVVAKPATNSAQSSAPASATASTTVATKPVQSGGMFENVPTEPVHHEASASATASMPASSATHTPPPTPVSAPVPTPAPITPPPTLPVEAPPKAIVAIPAAPKSVEDGPVLNVNGIAWRWPNGGKVIGGFVSGDQTKQGVDIAGSAGDPVQAAADGEVVYSGNGLLGYGELIIVKHNASFLSAYGHNRKRLVQEGDKVKAGQQIAEMGSSASSRDELHFEIRKNGKPVNPQDYLPAR